MCIAYVIELLPSRIPTTGTEGYAAALASANEMNEKRLAALEHTILQLARPTTTMAAINAPPVTSAHRAKKYCFLHGQRGHTGRECKTLAAMTEDTTPGLVAMKDATAPCTINGKIGASKNGRRLIA